jgi:hypothetical protein
MMVAFVDAAHGIEVGLQLGVGVGLSKEELEPHVRALDVGPGVEEAA